VGRVLDLLNTLRFLCFATKPSRIEETPGLDVFENFQKRRGIAGGVGVFGENIYIYIYIYIYLLQRTFGSRYFEGSKEPPGIIKTPVVLGQMSDFVRTAIIYDSQVFLRF
jgi:hypothetical protein